MRLPGKRVMAVTAAVVVVLAGAIALAGGAGQILGLLGPNGAGKPVAGL